MAFPATTPTSQPQASALLSNAAGAAGLTNAVPFDRLTNLEQVVGNLFSDIAPSANVSTTGTIGYRTGAGGAVTQATSKSTGVTLSKLCGTVTMNNAALAADAIVSFVLTNTNIDANDVLILNHISGGTPGSYVLNARAAAGSATVDVTNVSAGSLSEAIVIQFVVIKAVAA